MQNILSDLKAKNYHPLYFLHGEEPYFIDVISNYIEDHILDEGEQSFNQSVLYGKETTAQQVVDACMQYPMMASHRVVILKEAQEKGYAEADPTFDVDGIDAAHKLVLLGALAFGVKPDFKALNIQGIGHITSKDIEYADELGYRIKLLGYSVL